MAKYASTRAAWWKKNRVKLRTYRTRMHRISRKRNLKHARRYHQEFRKRRHDQCEAVKKRSDAKPRSRWLRSIRLASRRGFIWNIGFRTFSNLIKLPCHYCGGPLPWSCSGLDRIDNAKDYTRRNVVPCCRLCNWMKRDLTMHQFLRHISRIHATLNTK